MSEKTYINGLFIKDVKSQYGEIDMSIKVDTFCEQIKALQDEQGYTKIRIKPRKEADKYGNTRYAELNTWKPEPKTGATAEYTKKALTDNAKTVGVESEDNCLPF